MGRIEATAPERGISPSDFPRNFREELDYYDSEIESLRSDEWASPPTPRARAQRIDGKQFHRKAAQDVKRWSMVQGFMYGMATSTLRDTDQVHPREAYAPGVIFSAPFHTASSQDEMWVSVEDPNLTATPFGTICSKYRKMVVLKTFGEHCSCAPIYTHNGLGLQGKQFPDEFVSIRDVADPRPEPAEGRHGRLLAEKYSTYTGTGIKGKSVVKLTETHSHRYDAPATIEGILEPKSLSKGRLLEMVKMMTS
ncbi:hypothetical protein F5X96DRAFT_679183 [Biscogniauxia mediterranea]|nr:hypothetical protein F5X96DRAFT_679183 [Biscogniauxia mediterranea]